MFAPLLWISVAFLAGIALAAHVHLSISTCIGLGVMSVLPVLLPAQFRPSSFRPRIPYGIRRPTFALVCFALLFFFLGAARYDQVVARPATAQVDSFNDRKYDLFITGTVVDPPDVRDTYTNLRLRVESVDTSKKQYGVGGLILARVAVNRTYTYGQNLRLRGLLQSPPENEDFSYKDYLARQGIHGYMPDAEATVLPGSTANPILTWIYTLKGKLLDNVYRLFLDPEASLLAGILLGVDAGLPGPLQQAFKDTGTAHIIAISGFNIAIIAGIFVMIFSRFLGPRRGALAAVAGIAFYTFLVGADPSVVRAALMGTLSLFALQVGRRQMGVNTLMFVGAIMAAFNPQVLWDVGFQLSFFATLGLLLYGNLFQSATEGFLGRFLPASNAEKLTAVLAEFVLLTFAAQLTTLPIMAYHFQQISLVSFIANPFVLPAQPAVMILGGVAVFVSMFIFPLGKLLALIAWPLTAYTIRMVELFDSLPHGVIYLGGFSLGFVFLFYGVLLTVTYGGTRLKALWDSLRHRFRFLTLGTVLTALFICTLLTWRLTGAAPDGKLHITFISTGSADAVLIQTPTGHNVLINGGPSTSALSDALGRRISPLAQELDWLVIATADEQQMASLPRILPRYPPKNVLLAASAGTSFSSRTVMDWVDTHSVPVTEAKTGQLFDLGDGALLKVIDVSTRGATLMISWNEFHALLPIGANVNTLKQLQNGEAVGPIQVLSLAQSGYAPLTPPDWISNLNPSLVVISVGAGDANNRPDKETLEALSGRSLLRTDINGWIDVASDGTHMWVTVERKTPEPPATEVVTPASTIISTATSTPVKRTHSTRVPTPVSTP